MKINQASFLLEQNKYVINHFKKSVKKTKKNINYWIKWISRSNILSTLINLKKI